MSASNSTSFFKLNFRHRHPFVVPVITFFALFFASCIGLVMTGGETIGAKDSRIVQLYVDGKKRAVPTRASTVGEVLNRLDVELREEDVVDPAVDSPITGNNFSINIYRARPVTIIDSGGQKTRAKIADREPSDIARKAGLTIYPEDKLTAMSPAGVLHSGVIGEQIVIDRALPVKLSLYGTTYDIRTQAHSVAELVKERGIHYDQASVLPDPETALKANDIVFVTEVGKQIAVVEEAISPPVQYVDSADLDIGTTKTKEEGTPGKKVVVYDVAPNGAKKPLQEIVVLQPVRKLVARGVKPKPGFDGGFDAALARLRSCEGSYSSNTGNGYYGAYQFDVGTWGNYGGYPNAAAAPPLVQDQKAKETYMRRGWQPWPSCKNKMGLQDVYR